MAFFLSRVLALGIASGISVVLGLGVRKLAGTDTATISFLGAGAFIFALADIRFWNVKDMSEDMLEAEESSTALAEIRETIEKRQSLLWSRWYSSLLTLAVVSGCALVLQFGVDLPIRTVIGLTAGGYCALGAAAVLTLWMGRDLRDFEKFRADRRQLRLERGEWEEEVKRMTETPKPDFSTDKHLKGYGVTRRIKHV